MTDETYEKRTLAQRTAYSLRKKKEQGGIDESQLERLRAIGFAFTGDVFLSLAEARPDLAVEWHPNKNGTLTPWDVVSTAKITVWWRHWHAETGSWHEWRSPVVNRAKLGSGCLYCSNRKALPGFNDLATVRPDLAARWHPTKNGDLTPRDVTAGSRKKVWWKCPVCGHESYSSIARGGGCIVCQHEAAKRPTVGVDDLATVRPDVAAEWDWEKNFPLTPSDVKSGSGQEVWWKCGKCGHSWKRMVGLRTNRSKGSGCPACAGYVTVPGINDLATVKPDIAARWHPTKNGDLTPHDVTAGSAKRVWWKCPDCGHEFQRRVCDIASGGVLPCPKCGKKKAFAGRALADRADLMALLDEEGNAGVDPEAIPLGSSTTLLAWRCSECGHVYEMSPYQRAKMKGPCPVCTGDVVIPGLNDLASRVPEVAAMWHQEKNDGLAPSEVWWKSSRKVWWRCAQGHEWEQQVRDRVRQSAKRQCPICDAPPNKKRPVVNLDTGQTYESVRGAAIAAGIDPTTFRGALRKGVPCGGYHWRYAVDDGTTSQPPKEDEQ